MNDTPFDPDAGRFPGRGNLARELIGDHAAQHAECGERDATPTEDTGEPVEDAFEALRVDFQDALKPGINPETFFHDLRDALAEKGLLADCRNKKKSVSENEWQQLACRLIAMWQYIVKNPNPSAIFAAGYVQNVPMIDDFQSGMNQEQFASTLLGRRTIGFREDGSVYSKQMEQTRAAVNNSCMDAQKHFGKLFKLQPREECRDQAARDKQRTARVNQLVTT